MTLCTLCLLTSALAADDELRFTDITLQAGTAMRASGMVSKPTLISFAVVRISIQRIESK